MTLRSGSIEGKQLNLCRGNIIFRHVDSFCLQGEIKAVLGMLRQSIGQ